MGLESFLSRYSSSTQYVQVHLLEPQASRWIFSCSLLVLKSFSQVDSLCILWISSAGLWVATIWTETFTYVSSFLGLYWVSMVVFRNVTWSMGHSPVNVMVWCYLLIVGEVCGIFGHGSRLQRHHQCISTICSVLLLSS